MRTSNLQIPSATKVTGLQTEIPYIPGSVIPLLGAWNVRNTGDAFTQAGIRVTLLADGTWGDRTKLVIFENGTGDEGANKLTAGNWSTTYPMTIGPMSFDSMTEVQEPSETLRFEVFLIADELWDEHKSGWWVVEMKMFDLYIGKEAETSRGGIESTYEVRNFFRLVN